MEAVVLVGILVASWCVLFGSFAGRYDGYSPEEKKKRIRKALRRW